MKILRTNLRPNWTYKTGKKVWRLLPGNGVLVIELRDPDAKTSEYAGIDLASGSLLWEGLRLEDSWWVVINRIFKDVLLLQQFVKPDMPTPGKIFAVDLFTGKLLWQNDELSYVNASGDLVYGLRTSLQSEDIVGLDLRTGAERIIISSDDPRADQLSVPVYNDEFILSNFFEEIAGDLSQEHSARLRKAHPAGAANPTYVLSISGKDVIGFYIDAGKDEKGVPVFDSHLRVIDSEGKTVFDDVVDRRVYTTLGDFYFIVGTRLIYARNSDEVVAVNLES